MTDAKPLLEARQVFKGFFGNPVLKGVDIALAVPHPIGLRLDRLLATGLGLSRSRIGTLMDMGRLEA